MRNLTPAFILEYVGRGDQSGQFDAAVLFIDTSGFTPLTVRLSEQGRAGSETLADILHAVFEPLIEAVYSHGGFIAGFAGDAFKAVFPTFGFPTAAFSEAGSQNCLRALAAAKEIQDHMAANPSHDTRYGTFAFSVRICLADGRVTWSVWRDQDASQRATKSVTNSDSQISGYTFAGPAIEAAIEGENHADGGELVLTQAVYEKVREIDSSVDSSVVAGAPLSGSAKGYVLVHHIAESLLTSVAPIQDSSLQDLTVQDSISIAASAGDFYPSMLLNTTTRGEFRSVYTVFINVQHLPDPGAENDFLPAFFQLLNQYGGYLCRIGRIGANDPGGTFLLFWGAPISHENDLERVLSFLLTIEQALDVPLRAGVTHALVYAGFVGSPRREEYTCYGPSVNQAARQMTTANWHQLLLDAETARRAQEGFIIPVAGRFQLKGMERKQELFTLLGRQNQSGPQYHQSDFVGRHHELAQLQNAIQPIFENRFAGITLVEGEAGIGKSRLVHEFLMMTDMTQDVQIFVGQVDEILRESFNPFRYFLHRYFEQSPIADSQHNRATFEAIFGTLIAAVDDPNLAAELNRTHSFLGALLNLYWPESLYEQIEPQLRRENTLTALKTLLQAESHRKPLILLIEDGQWLDSESTVFLERLARAAEEMPLAVLVTARPISDERDSILSAESIHQALRVDPLAKAEIAELACDYLGLPPSDALVDLLVARAEGNPFFVEQVLLYLQEQGQLVSVAGSQGKSWQLVESAAETESIVPTDLQAVLVARLDQLTQEVKHVVQTAAILGREFSVQVLSQMLRGDSMLDRKMLSAQESAVWNSVSELRYLFRHALLRDAAYEMQLRARLQELHLIAAQSYELVFGEAELAPYYADLVYHYRHANQPNHEAHYALLAADRAAETHAVDDAIALYSRAFELSDLVEESQKFDLLIKRVELYNLRGMREAQAADLAALESLSKQMGEPRKQAEIALLVSAYAEKTGAYDRSMGAAETAYQLAPDIPEIRTRATMQIAAILMNRDHYVEAQTRTEEAIQEAQMAGLQWEEAANLHQLGIIRYYLGDYQEATEFCNKSLAIYRDLDEPLEIGRVLHSLGNITSKISEYRDTRYFDEARVIWNRIGYTRGQLMINIGIGNIHLAAGKYDLAQQSYKRALRIATEVSDPLGIGNLTFNLAVVASRTGLYDQAIDRCEIVRQQYTSLGYQKGVAMISLVLGNVEHARGNLSHSLNHFEFGITQLKEIGALSETGDAYTSMGKTLFTMGRIEDAQNAFERSLKIRRDLGRDTIAVVPAVWLARIAVELGKLEEARAQIDLLLEQLDEDAIMRTYDPGQLYWVLYQTLSLLQHDRAFGVLKTANALLRERSLQIQDSGMARSYLENVPAHRQLIAAYEQHDPSL